MRDDVRLALHLFAALVNGVGIGQRKERAAQQRERQHHDACGQHEILPVDRAPATGEVPALFCLFLRRGLCGLLFCFFCHGFTSLQTCSQRPRPF